MEKATFRLPEWEMKRLRDESTRQRRSLNLVVIDVIARGLGEHDHGGDVLRALGTMVARPAVSTYHAPEHEEADRPRLTDALDWARGEG